jgi:hypothetical protein
VATSAAEAAPKLQDYRMFRALSIDLQGRIPTRDEIAAFETDGFDLDNWIEERLSGEGYAERLRRTYLELLRLQVGPALRFVPQITLLHRQTVLDEGGKEIPVYYRFNQRRQDPITDGAFCFPMGVTGQSYPTNSVAQGTKKPVSAADFAKYAVKVKPWWLYKDYNKATPTQRYGDGWGGPGSGFELTPNLQTDPDKSAPNEVWVCKEEAQAAATGTVYASGLTKKPATLPEGRFSFPPLDSSFATANKGKPISCTVGTALASSADCGCGPRMERCMPGDSHANSPMAFRLPSHSPLADETAFDTTSQAAEGWWRYWWNQEAVRFLDGLFLEDRDFREVLTSPASYVNGPLTQFYNHIAPSTCCGAGISLGYTTPVPLFEPAGLPKLLAHDVSTWKKVENRGPLASGLLTMPVFLSKYGSRRARAHVLYTAFLCKEFVAENLDFVTSDEQDLAKRPGCSACHAKLEPMAAYFGRVMESDWTFLPADKFPLAKEDCKPDANGQLTGVCRTYYEKLDASKPATLRGIFSAPDHADEGPAGIAKLLTSDPGFGRCAVSNITSSFLGRALKETDQEMIDSLTDTFEKSGYRMRKLVAAVVKSKAYREGNNLSSDAWRTASEAP